MAVTITSWIKSNLITVVCFIFSLGVMYATLGAKMTDAEKRLNYIESLNPQEIRLRQDHVIKTLEKIDTLIERNDVEHGTLKNMLSSNSTEIQLIRKDVETLLKQYGIARK